MNEYISKCVTAKNGITYTVIDGELAEPVQKVDNNLLYSISAWLETLGVDMPAVESWDDKFVNYFSVAVRSLLNILKKFGIEKKEN